MSNEPASVHVETRRAAYAAFADRVWATPELNFAEVRSAEEHRRMIAAEGFRPLDRIAGIPTAVGGEWGEGGPVIAILGEYDALPGLSQTAGASAPQEVEPDGNGHGCGHNLLGAASLMAAAGVKDWLEKTGRPGRVRYLGCPAEEGGSAKGFMVREGVFDDVDVAICWHPAPVTCVMAPAALANVEAEFVFRGRSAHAAAAPHLGRSALDAVELMNIGVNYLREHMPPGARVHYAVTDTGGVAPNVVQARATARHLVRTRSLTELWPLFDRVCDIARGAALMTGTKVEWRQISGDAELVGNSVLEGLMDRALRGLGGPGFDETDLVYAREIQATLDEAELREAEAEWSLRQTPALMEEILPAGTGKNDAIGSTDVGTVSWVVPTVQAWVATCAMGTPGHSWQMTAQGCSPAAHKGMTFAAKAMAETAAALISDPALVSAAKAELAAFRQGRPFRNPVEDVDLVLPAAAR